MTAVDAPALLDYDDVLAKYEPVLGMEVHVELGTNTKMFCPCPTEFGAEPNTQVCPVCLGLPGSLPVVNEAAVESAIRIGLALNCSITPWGRFARKNYFYPDQPKNYQISQYDEPIATDGYLDVVLDDGTTWRVEIERAHMEEDTGKSLKVSDVRMDQGSMRCDSNVSLMPIGATELGTRTETKNVNSLKSVEVAVRYEMRRQAAVLESGGAVIQETRHFQEADGTTSPGRRKETAEDYRYFPEPDLEPVAPSAEWIEELRGTLPELPWVRRARIQADWGVSDEVMRDLVNAGALDLVIATAEAGASPEAARSWWVSYLAQQANTRGVELTALPITPAQVAEVVALIDNGTLNNKVARQVVDRVLDGEGDPKQVVANHPEFVVERDDTKLKAAVDEALAANPDIADKIRGGKVAAAGKIVGDVMKATRGQADPARVKELVIEACS